MNNKVKHYKITRNHSNVASGSLILSPKCRIGRGVVLDVTGDLIIGDHSEVNDDVKIITHKHHWNHSKDLRVNIQKIEPVNLKIGNDVFIGINSIILSVKSIGDGAIIGAGSIVTKDIPPYEVWAGNPARKIGERG